MGKEKKKMGSTKSHWASKNDPGLFRVRFRLQMLGLDLGYFLLGPYRPSFYCDKHSTFNLDSSDAIESKIALCRMKIDCRNVSSASVRTLLDNFDHKLFR